MASFRQLSFSKGEVAPALYSRVDQTAYATGLKTLKNFLVKKEGGGQNRPGTKFVGEVYDSSKITRLIPFDNGDGDTWALEFGHNSLRFYTEGAQYLNSGVTITGVTNANPGVVSYSGSDPSNGDQVFVTGISGAIGTYLNNRVFVVANVNAGANTFELTYIGGSNVNTTSFGSYGSGGTFQGIPTGAVSYTQSDVFGLDYCQDGGTITLAHQSYIPTDISGIGGVLVINSSAMSPSITGRTTTFSGAATAGGAGTNEYRYRIVGVSNLVSSGGEEGLPAWETPRTITAASQANPCAITTSASHGYVTGDEIYISGVLGMTQLNNKLYRITVTGAATFTLNSIDSTAYTAYSSAGSSYRTSIGVTSAAPTVTAPIQITISASTTSLQYFVYKEQGGVFGFIGFILPPTDNIVSGTSLLFKDTGIAPDILDTPFDVSDPTNGLAVYRSSGNYPRAVCLHEQRKVFAGTSNNVAEFRASMVGYPRNFANRAIPLPSDSVTATIKSSTLPRIKYMAPIGDLAFFCDRGEFALNKGSVDGLSPTNVNVSQEGYTGCASVKPVAVNSSLLFVDKGHSGVFDLGFMFEADGYRGSEISVFSSHLFKGHTIVDAAVQRTPDPIAWFVRDDGVLLSCTYVKEHQVFGWARHEFENGLVESVCAIPEGNSDALYLIVKRTINGSSKRYVERMEDRFFEEADIEDVIFMDSALTYDGWNVAATTMTTSLGTGWTATDTQTMTASAATFASTDVGNAIHLRSGTTIIRFEIVAFTSTTIVTVRPSQDVPAAFQGIAFTDWADAVDEITGLWHLEGEDVSVFADGYVVASPNNSDYTVLTVTNGAITLDRPYAKVHVGLPITADLKALDVDTTQGVIASKKKLTSKAFLQVESSRGMFIGSEEPSSGLTGLDEPKIRQMEGYNEPVDLLTGLVEVVVQSRWGFSGGVFVRQVDPVPLTINSVIMEGNV